MRRSTEAIGLDSGVRSIFLAFLTFAIPFCLAFTVLTLLLFAACVLLALCFAQEA
jgi:hypothetical protein